MFNTFRRRRKLVKSVLNKTSPLTKKDALSLIKTFSDGVSFIIGTVLFVILDALLFDTSSSTVTLLIIIALETVLARALFKYFKNSIDSLKYTYNLFRFLKKFLFPFSLIGFIMLYFIHNNLTIENLLLEEMLKLLELDFSLLTFISIQIILFVHLPKKLFKDENLLNELLNNSNNDNNINEDILD